jgi:hypothetical protein
MVADPQIGYTKLIEFVVETFVRRQIQLDTMSREQGRLVRLVIVVQPSFSGWWRMFGQYFVRHLMRVISSHHQWHIINGITVFLFSFFFFFFFLF